MVDNQQQMRVIANLLIVPMTIAIFISLESDLLPAWLVGICRWLPTTAAFDLMRASFTPHTELAFIAPRLVVILLVHCSLIGCGCLENQALRPCCELSMTMNKFQPSTRIILAVAEKDIGEALKNRTLLMIAIGVLTLMLTGPALSLLVNRRPANFGDVCAGWPADVPTAGAAG